MFPVLMCANTSQSRINQSVPTTATLPLPKRMPQYRTMLTNAILKPIQILKAKARTGGKSKVSVNEDIPVKVTAVTALIVHPTASNASRGSMIEVKSIIIADQTSPATQSAAFARRSMRVALNKKPCLSILETKLLGLLRTAAKSNAQLISKNASQLMTINNLTGERNHLRGEATDLDDAYNFQLEAEKKARAEYNQLADEHNELAQAYDTAMEFNDNTHKQLWERITCAIEDMKTMAVREKAAYANLEKVCEVYVQLVNQNDQVTRTLQHANADILQLHQEKESFRQAAESASAWYTECTNELLAHKATKDAYEEAKMTNEVLIEECRRIVDDRNDLALAHEETIQAKDDKIAALEKELAAMRATKITEPDHLRKVSGSSTLSTLSSGDLFSTTSIDPESNTLMTITRVTSDDEQVIESSLTEDVADKHPDTQTARDTGTLPDTEMLEELPRVGRGKDEDLRINSKKHDEQETSESENDTEDQGHESEIETKDEDDSDPDDDSESHGDSSDYDIIAEPPSGNDEREAPALSDDGSSNRSEQTSLPTDRLILEPVALSTRPVTTPEKKGYSMTEADLGNNAVDDFGPVATPVRASIPYSLTEANLWDNAVDIFNPVDERTAGTTDTTSVPDSGTFN